MDYLALKLPGGYSITAPPSVPQGGLEFATRVIGVGLNVFIIIGILAALTFLMYGGFVWITSGGDKQKLERARKTIVYSIIGIFVMALSLVAVQFLGDMLGVQLFTKPLENPPDCGSLPPGTPC